MNLEENRNKLNRNQLTCFLFLYVPCCLLLSYYFARAGSQGRISPIVRILSMAEITKIEENFCSELSEAKVHNLEHYKRNRCT